MTTHYGLNPSFCTWTSTLPLFGNLLPRGRSFEKLDAHGMPTGEAAPIDPVTGLPPRDGAHYGVRVFGGDSPAPTGLASSGVDLKGTPGGLLVASKANWLGTEWVGDMTTWHNPSLAALRSFKPSVLRTLDLQLTNKRPDWSKPRVGVRDLLQGTDRGMSVVLQAALANRLGAALWWCAPPRFELPVDDYEAQLEKMLGEIQSEANQPPILEYGNELWNSGFAVHGWLADLDGANMGLVTWHDAAAFEIATLKRVADRVFGPHGPLGRRAYYLFVGGQLTVPSHLDKILSALADLGVTPDLAGPALYVTPLKASIHEWEATGAVPTQDELRASCMARLEEIASRQPVIGSLTQHALIVRQKYNVPYFACYEAGQSLIAGGHPWRKAALEAQRTEWMGDLYRGIRRAAEAAGVDLLNWYSAATSQTPADKMQDVFGLLESTDLSKALPKAIAARGE